MNGKRILLLGWSQPAVAALTSLGAEVVAVVDPNKASKARADSCGALVLVATDHANVDDVVAVLARQCLGLEDFSLVATQSEYAVVATAVLAALGNASGMDIPTAVALRDKFVQKQRVRDAGLPVAGCRVVDDLSDLVRLRLSSPVVIKPLAGAGSRDTYQLRGPGDLTALLERGTLATYGPWLLEEYVEGRELHIDGVVRDGEVLFQSISRYLQNVIEIKAGGLVGSVMLNPHLHAKIYERTHELLTDALRALGHRNGVFHVEVFERDDDLTFSECGGRIGGGMIQESIALRYGVDLAAWWAAITLGQQDPPRRAEREEACGWLQLPAPPGHVLSVPSEPELLARPGVVQAQLMAQVGHRMPDVSISSNLNAGKVVVTASTESEVEQHMRELVPWFVSAVAVE